MIFLHVYTHRRLYLTCRTFVRVCTEFDSIKVTGRVWSLVCNGHPSIWWPHLIMLNFGFWERLPLNRTLDFVRCSLRNYSHKVKETAYKTVVSDHPWSTPVPYGTPAPSAAADWESPEVCTVQQGGPCRTTSWHPVRLPCLKLLQSNQTHKAAQIQKWSAKY